MPVNDAGSLDEALERLHATGPERAGRLSSHAPMAVEALAAAPRTIELSEPMS
ncbi:hypothetical protein DMH02_010410 [Streptomyces sp. WAC 00631]|uniref:hypothetical protein n=1 Tax=unclassified Streptomyces TaxID=2593676 RepID=UPI00163BA323|nr:MULTISPECIES: hypothetical protein [unclassified Streptomyces]MCC5033623.1 hypothetical protein [Streptomyces sp. WAC 00631]MCC9742983.1 hypothetical protein [Streptomyces sp. MNU89]